MLVGEELAIQSSSSRRVTDCIVWGQELGQAAAASRECRNTYYPISLPVSYHKIAGIRYLLTLHHPQLMLVESFRLEGNQCIAHNGLGPNNHDEKTNHLDFFVPGHLRTHFRFSRNVKDKH